MASESKKNNSLTRDNAQAVLNKAETERAKTKGELDTARKQLGQAKATLDALDGYKGTTEKHTAADVAAEKVNTLESKLSKASEQLRQAEEDREFAMGAKKAAQNAHRMAIRSNREANFTTLERKLKKAQDEFAVVRREARFVDGDALKAKSAIDRAEAELKDARAAYDTATSKLQTAQAEMDAAVAVYLKTKTPETERRYDAALNARSDAEEAVARTAKYLETAEAQNKEAQESAYLVRDAGKVKEAYARKERALDEANKALNRAKSAQKLTESRMHMTEADFERKTAALEKSEQIIDNLSKDISEIMGDLKVARKELAVARKSHDDGAVTRAGAESAVAEGQARVNSLASRLHQLDKIIADAKHLLEE